MGSLYSRSIGALAAKGSYIFSLDSDDIFLVPDLFEIIYILASQDNFDIVQFRALIAKSYSPIINEINDDIILDNPHNLVLTQPRLGKCTIFNYNRFSTHDVYVLGKIIRTDIYQKAVNLLGKEKYSIFITWSEDNIITFLIYNLAKSFKSVKKYGIFHFSFKSNEGYNNDRKIMGKILFSDVIYDFTDNNSDKNFAVDAILDIMKSGFFSVKNNKFISEYFKKFSQKILESKYISETKKNRFREKYSKIQFFQEKIHI